MNTWKTVLIGFIITILIFALAFSRLAGDFSLYLLLASPLMGGFAAAYLSKGNYKTSFIVGMLSSIPLAAIITILGFLILNAASGEGLFTGGFMGDISNMAVFVLIFLIFIAIGGAGGLLGIFCRKKMKKTDKGL